MWTKKRFFFFHLVSVAFPEWSPCANKMILSTWPTTVLVTCRETTHTKKIYIQKNPPPRKRKIAYMSKNKSLPYFIMWAISEDQVSVQPLLVFEFFIILFLKVTIAQTLDFVPWPRTCILCPSPGQFQHGLGFSPVWCPHWPSKRWRLAQVNLNKVCTSDGTLPSPHRCDITLEW